MSLNRRNCLLAAALALLAALAFWPVLSAGFISMDDDLYVTKNPHIHAVTAQNAVFLLTHTHEFLYHPLSLLSFMLDHALFGDRPMGYHAVNLAVHLLVVVLVFTLLLRMTGDPWRSVLAAALFAIHPLRVESIAWVSERKDVLALLFATLAFIAYVRFARLRNDRGAWPVILLAYGLVLVLLVLSLMAKPALVTFPFLAFILDFWPLRRMAEPKAFPREIAARLPMALPQGRRVMVLILEKLPLLVLVIAWAHFSRSMGGAESIAAETAADVPLAPFSVRLGNAPVAMALYLRNHFTLGWLAIPYPLPPDGWPAGVIALSSLLWVAITIFTLAQSRRRPWLIAGWAWFCVALGPFVGIVYIGDYALADRYTYLADIGLFFAIAWSIPAVAWRESAWRKWVMAVVTIVVVTLIVASRIQSGYWKDDRALFGHAVNVTDANARAYAGLAAGDERNGDYAAAVSDFAHAVRFAQDERLFTFMGNDCARLGDYPRAIDAYRTALKINPAFAMACYKLGLALEHQGDIDGAREAFTQAIRIASNFAAAGNALLALDHMDGLPTTISACRAAIAREPGSAPLHAQLAELLEEQNLTQQAIAEHEKALQLDPRRPMDEINLGIDLAAMSQWPQAIEHYRRALVIAPHNPDAHLNLAEALVQLGQLSEALEHCRQALAIRPSDFDINYDLGVILQKMGQRRDAAAAFQHALQLRPGDPQAQAAVRDLTP